MLNKLSTYALVVRDRKRTLDVLSADKFKKNRQTADIIRLTHAIEKGLCLEEPRLGFGAAKLNKLFSLCREYANAFGCDEFCLKMARDAVKAYIAFHKEKEYQSEAFAQICAEYDAFPCKDTGEQEVYGGTLHIQNKCELSIEQLETFFADRHSIRDFVRKEVDDEIIMRAVRAAQYAPSACNRQAVRAYVLSSKQLCQLYGSNLEGVGGFAENADKFILITGQLSAYNQGEYNQHIVSASIFATYLMQALFAQNIGTCIVQRPLYYFKQWDQIAKAIGAPEDERLVFMIAVGHMKEEYTVPVSKRFPPEQVVKFIKDKQD